MFPISHVNSEGPESRPHRDQNHGRGTSHFQDNIHISHAPVINIMTTAPAVHMYNVQIVLV